MILQHINPYGEKFYFQNLGLPWPHDMTKRLIERTTRDRAEATVFEDADSALLVLLKAGQPRNWTVEE